MSASGPVGGAARAASTIASARHSARGARSPAACAMARRAPPGRYRSSGFRERAGPPPRRGPRRSPSRRVAARRAGTRRRRRRRSAVDLLGATYGAAPAGVSPPRPTGRRSPTQRHPEREITRDSGGGAVHDRRTLLALVWANWTLARVGHHPRRRRRRQRSGRQQPASGSPSPRAATRQSSLGGGSPATAGREVLQQVAARSSPSPALEPDGSAATVSATGAASPAAGLRRRRERPRATRPRPRLRKRPAPRCAARQARGDVSFSPSPRQHLRHRRASGRHLPTPGGVVRRGGDASPARRRAARAMADGAGARPAGSSARLEDLLHLYEGGDGERPARLPLLGHVSPGDALGRDDGQPLAVLGRT